MGPVARNLPGQMRIGSVLEQARTRAGLDLREVEQRTKIRVKYLQALEDEEWSELPSSAYAKGFLRTYGELLGLDGEALVDEYRRQVERDTDDRGYPLGDRRERDRATGGRDRSRFWPALAAALLIAITAVILVVLSDDDGRDGERRRQAGADRQADQRQADGGRRERERGSSGPVELAIRVREPLELCLVGGGGEALIDGQVLAAGTRERYVRERFELRFASGFDADQLRLVIGGQRRALAAEGPAAFEITAPARVERVEPRGGRGCP